MKKIIVFLAITAIMVVTAQIQTFAAEIVAIDVEVILHHDGSAQVSETWTTAAVYEGTQISRVMNLPSNMAIHSLTISDINENEFLIVDDWEQRLTFEARAEHGSLLTTASGYEIVWGITEHGDNRYVITYHLDNLVQSFSDGSGFFHQFVSYDLSPAPNRVFLRLSALDTALSYENMVIDVFGMDANVEIQDGVATIESSAPFTAANALELRVLFDEALFAPLILHEELFEEALMINERDFELMLILAIVVALAFCIFGVIMITTAFSTRTKLIDGTIKKRLPIKEIPIKYQPPYDLDLPALYYLSRQPSPFYLDASAFGAYLVKWSQAKIIEIIKTKKSYTITVLPLQTQLPEIEQDLYELLENWLDTNRQLSSANEEMWLQLMEEINEWEADLFEIGSEALLQAGIIAVDEKQRRRFTHSGYQTLLEFWGFLKYLKTENQLSQPFTQDHLIIATMAGLQKAMKKYFEQHVDTTDELFMFWNLMWMSQAFNTQVQATYQSHHESTSSTSFSGTSTGGGGGGIS